MTDQFISIVMCTYNGAKFLEEQIRSILNQTHSNFELIICDDNSTDATREILERFTKEDKRITLYRNEQNIGYNKNFEKAIFKANSSFVCISDQDDIWLSNKVTTLFELLLKNTAVLVYHNTFHFEDIPGYEKKENTKINVIDSDDPAYDIFHNSISGHTVLFNKTIINNVAFPQDVYYDWWLAVLALTNGKVKGTTEMLSYHRIHAANASTKTGHNKFLSHKECNEKIHAYHAFLGIADIGAKNKIKLRRLIKYYTSLLNKSFNFSLFIYLIINSGKFLYYKKKGFLYFSRIKTCYRMSRVV